MFLFLVDLQIRFINFSYFQIILQLSGVNKYFIKVYFVYYFMIQKVTRANSFCNKGYWRFATQNRNTLNKYIKLEPLFESLTGIMQKRPWPLVFRKNVNYNTNLVPSHNFPYNAFKKVTPELIYKRETILIETLNKIYKQLCELDSSFYQVVSKTNHICLNKNLASIKHVDKNNVGRSVIFTLGNYTTEKGKLYFDATETEPALEIDPFKNPTIIDGKREHYNHIEQNKVRYSIIIFGHVRDDVDNYSEVLKALKEN